MRTWLCLGLLAATGLGTASAQTTRPSTTPAEPSLDAVDGDLGTLTIASQPLATVLEMLGERAGVRFSVDEDTYALLPWGRETRLASLELKGATLRQALEEIIRPLGLVYRVRERSIAIEPSEPLERMNRRATWNDLKLIASMQSTPYSAEAFDKLTVQYRITSKVNAPQLLKTQLKRAGSGSLCDVLTTAANALGWTWFTDEDHIVVLSSEAFIAHNLARTVTLRYKDMGLAHILLDLATKADVPLSIEPGLMQKLPPSTAQSYSLFVQETSVRQALELICAETGLEYQVRRDGLFVTLPPATAARAGAAPRAARGDPYAARILVPAKSGGFSYEILIRESELPDDVREYRSQMISEMVERMRQDMAPEPTTRPAGG